MSKTKDGPIALKTSINNFIDKLSSDSGVERERARQGLVNLGKPAVAPLVNLLPSPKVRVRWEAAQTIKDIADPSAAHALVRTLEDENFDVRWLAAEALIRIGDGAVDPLLAALVERSDRPWLRASAHHILAHLSGQDAAVEHHIQTHPAPPEHLKRVLPPVVKALEDLDSTVAVPPAARAALNTLRKR